MDFLTALQNTVQDDGSRKCSDRTIIRMSAHLKTFGKWLHQHRPFPLGQPMTKIKILSVGNKLEIERALTKQERNRILDAADQLLPVGGRSGDRQGMGGVQYGENRQCDLGATAVGAQEHLIFSLVFPHNQR